MRAESDETKPLNGRSPESPRKSGAEWKKFLPIVFVSSVIATLYLIYTCVHLVRCFQWDKDKSDRDAALVTTGTWQGFVFHALVLLLVWSYVRCITTSPGHIPNTKEWQFKEGCDEAQEALRLQETKKSGDRRHCKWCQKYKPDRTHHCRVCKVCVLKMDHHCPWIYNCVGFGNHKYFFLLLLYTSLACIFLASTMFESTRAALEEEKSFWRMFLLLFGETLATCLGGLVTAFFGFHVWLASRAMTTIEFCEKNMKNAGFGNSPYLEGCLNNTKNVLGPNPLLWFLPVSPPKGTGLQFSTLKSTTTGRSARRSPKESKVVSEDDGETAPVAAPEDRIEDVA